MMFDSFENRVILSGTLTALTALRIGAGRATGVTGTDLPVVCDVLGKPYIPGSSLRGVLRSIIEATIRSVFDENNRKGACNIIDETKWCVVRGSPRTSEARKADKTWKYPSGGVSSHEMVGIKDLEAGLDDLPPTEWDRELGRRVQDESCLVCRVFGSPWMASKISICDLPVKEDTWFGQFENRNGVAIERDTETAADGKLYDFEVVPAGTQFKCEIVVENGADWELGLIMAGLRAFERGEASLGGARSRGLGRVVIDWHSRTRLNKDNLLSYLTDETGPTSIIPAEVKDWIKDFRTKLEGQSHA